MRARVGAFVVGMGYLLLLPAAMAADHPVDPGLLEFLGSVDSEDKDWHDYLARTDIDQVARRAGQPRRVPPPANAVPPPAASPTPPPADSPTPPPAPPSQVSQP